MATHDLRPLLRKITKRVKAHEVPGAPGAFSRWAWQDAAGKRVLGSTVYGCADAVHVLYTLNVLHGETSAVADMTRALQGFQDKEDGLFREAPMQPLHTTAFAAGALELLNARPLQEARGLLPYSTREGVRELMDSLDWKANPWAASHRGAGIYGAMLLAGSPGADWEDWYFEWLHENQDKRTGLWRTECVPLSASTEEGVAPHFHHLASTFHYLFSHDHARRPLRYTEELADTCLDFARNGLLPRTMGQGLSWNEIDWAYTLRSLQKRGSKRSAELGGLLSHLADTLLPAVEAIDPESSEEVNDLHTLFAGLSALAVLQEALPGRIRTDAPLRLVLDRKPFL